MRREQDFLGQWLSAESHAGLPSFCKVVHDVVASSAGCLGAR